MDPTLVHCVDSSSSSRESLHGLTRDTQTKGTSIRTVDHLSRHAHSSDGSSRRCRTDLRPARFLQASELHDHLRSSLVALVLLTRSSIAFSSSNRSVPRVSTIVVTRGIRSAPVLREAEATLSGNDLFSLATRKTNVTSFERSFSNRNWIYSIWLTIVIGCKWKQSDSRPLLTTNTPSTNLDLQRIEHAAISLNHRVRTDVRHPRDGTRGRK